MHVLPGGNQSSTGENTRRKKQRQTHKAQRLALFPPFPFLSPPLLLLPPLFPFLLPGTDRERAAEEKEGLLYGTIRAPLSRIHLITRTSADPRRPPRIVAVLCSEVPFCLEADRDCRRCRRYCWSALVDWCCAL